MFARRLARDRQRREAGRAAGPREHARAAVGRSRRAGRRRERRRPAGRSPAPRSARCRTCRCARERRKRRRWRKSERALRRMRAEEMRVGIAALQRAARRPVADDDGRARQIEARAAPRDFSRPRRGRRRERSGAANRDAWRARAEERVVDAARPDLDPVEAAPAEFLARSYGVGRHHRGGRRVKAPQRLRRSSARESPSRAEIYSGKRV